MVEPVEFIRLIGNEKRIGPSLASVSRHWQGRSERFLFISPHDDDAILGTGLLMQLAKRENVPVHLLIVTDGTMGYCSADDRTTISQTRKAETYAAYAKLGLSPENITWMGFPDCQLCNCLGRRLAAEGDPAAIAGYTGLQNSFTHHLRRIRPTQTFVATAADLHPDHRHTHNELMISIFHAAGEIWPELGEPLASVPYVNEYAVYCDFPGTPSLRVQASADLLTHKLEAIGCFISQRQIGAIVQAVSDAGPEEYFRSCDLALYHPAKYRMLFEQPLLLRTIRGPGM